MSELENEPTPVEETPEPTPELEPLNDEEVEADTDDVSGPPADEREPSARTLKRLGVNALGFPIGS